MLCRLKRNSPGGVKSLVRNAWAERTMRPRALAPDRTDGPLSNGIRLRGSRWRLQNLQAQLFDGFIEVA
jgi:hypothetical protein